MEFLQRLLVEVLSPAGDWTKASLALTKRPGRMLTKVTTAQTVGGCMEALPRAM
jgi:hypothetical protein